MKEDITTIRKLIKNARYEEAIEKLESLAIAHNDTRVIDELTMLSSTYNFLKREDRLGKRDIGLERNKFIGGLIDILNSVEFFVKGNRETSKTIQKPAKKLDFNLDSRMKSSKQIDLLCYSCKGVFEIYNFHLKKAIINGASVRIMHVKPNSTAYELMIEHTKVESMKGDIKMVLDRVKWLEESLSNSKEEIKGKYEVRYTTWIPSTNIFIFDRSLSSGVASIKINPVFYTTPMKERLSPQVFYKESNPIEFEYHCIQFEHLWKFHDSTVDGFKDSLEYFGDEL